MLATWHPLIWWDWCLPDNEKKEIALLLSNAFKASVVYKIEALKEFASKHA